MMSNPFLAAFAGDWSICYLTPPLFSSISFTLTVFHIRPMGCLFAII